MTSTFDEEIQGAFERLRKADQQVRVLRPLQTPIADWESKWFMQGLELGIFEIDVGRGPAGWPAARIVGPPFHVDTHLLMSPSIERGERAVFREVVTQVAAISRLVGEFGHTVESVVAESQHWEVDAVVYDSAATDVGATAIIGVEAKVPLREHMALAAALQVCRGVDEGHVAAIASGALPAAAASMAKNHHQKCRWIATSSTPVFWVISPFRSDVFEVVRDDGGQFRLIVSDESALHSLRV